ncbi:MAG: hypothetical protein QOJ51_4719, partial [Acidobacteriaceae bacterium]|nr:hypothetical protein [Acidobacteriaceae bacterium]
MTKVIAKITITKHLRFFCRPPGQGKMVRASYEPRRNGKRDRVERTSRQSCVDALRRDVWAVQYRRAMGHPTGSWRSFRFAPLQSELTAAILSRHGINREAVLKSNTVYLVLDAGTERERLLTQSDVTVNMLLLLGGRWRVLGYLL